MLPDLSENLSNEERTWEDIMQIKSMPISMHQKKQIKIELQVLTPSTFLKILKLSAFGLFFVFISL